MGTRLLVVDSDRRFIQDHKAALESAFDVDFRDGTEGSLAHLEGGGYAATLICVEASENKGYSLCSAIRRNPHLGELKIALISAKATDEEYARHQSLKGRADVYLHKPIRSAALVSALSPLAPARSIDPDNPLGDLGGMDLGDEWLESLRSELEVEPEPTPAPASGSAAFSSAAALVGLNRPLIPITHQSTQQLPVVPKDAGRIELLEARIKDLESKLVATSNELDGRTQQLKEWERRTAGLEADLAAATERQNQAASQWETQLAASLAELEQRGRDLEEARRNQQEAQGQAEARGRAGAELELRLADAESRLDEAGKELARTGQAMEEMRQETEAVHGLLAEKSHMTLDLMESNQLLQAQLAEAREEKGRLARGAQELQTRIHELEAEHAGLEQAHAGQGEALARLQTEMTAWQEEHDRLRLEFQAALDDREARLAALNLHLDERQERIRALEQERDEAARRLEARADRLRVVSEHLAGLEAQARQALEHARGETD
jgi:CheY-like chemotaxis protein